MAMTINTNVASLNAQRNLTKSQSTLQTRFERLSSGLRINSAKDDAAGLAISNRFSAQIRGLNQAVRNANDGISLAQVAEGSLQETTTALQRIRELAVQSANDTNSDSDRQSIQKEVVSLQAEINRIAETTSFNNKNLLDGSFGTAKFMVGANANQTIDVTTGDARGTAIGSWRTRLEGDAQVAGDAAAAKVETQWAAQDLVVNGSKGSATASIAVGVSAKDAAKAINAKTVDTGVTATARTQVEITTIADGSYKFELSTGDDTTATISAAVADGDFSDMVDAINDQSGTTGVTATLNDAKDGVILTDQDGDTITLARQDTTISTWTTQIRGDETESSINELTSSSVGTTDTASFRGSALLESEKAFSVNDTGAGADATSESSALTKVSSIDLKTQTGANDALTVLDKALAKIDGIRSELGAVQNRFSSTISNLMNVSENFSAARGRIMDADFATETAELTKAQITQQAGLAMLSQANQLPQSALSLLQ
jgi:flagellin